MTRPARAFTCHDCGDALADDDRLHYGYQCHGCAMSEHEIVLLSARDPDHPGVSARMVSISVDLSSGRPKIDRRRRAA